MSSLAPGVVTLMGQVCVQCRTACETETSYFSIKYINSLSGGWSPAGSTRHGGHWLAYCSLPQVIVMMENLVELRLARETEILWENLPHHKSHLTIPGIKPGLPRWEASDYPLELWRSLLNTLQPVSALLLVTTFPFVSRDILSVCWPVLPSRSNHTELCAATDFISLCMMVLLVFIYVQYVINYADVRYITGQFKWLISCAV
jgi:hypothetical protein